MLWVDIFHIFIDNLFVGSRFMFGFADCNHLLKVKFRKVNFLWLKKFNPRLVAISKTFRIFPQFFVNSHMNLSNKIPLKWMSTQVNDNNFLRLSSQPLLSFAPRDGMIECEENYREMPSLMRAEKAVVFIFFICQLFSLFAYRIDKHKRRSFP